MQWTYQQFTTQPEWFIDILGLVEDLDAQKAKADNDEAQRAMKDRSTRGKNVIRHR